MITASPSLRTKVVARRGTAPLFVGVLAILLTTPSAAHAGLVMATFLDRNVDAFSTDGTKVEMAITEGPTKVSGAPRTLARNEGTYRIGGTGATFARYTPTPGSPTSTPSIVQSAISGSATAISTVPGSVGSVSIDADYRETLTLTNLLASAQVVTLTITDTYTYRVTTTAPPGVSEASVLEMISARAPGVAIARGSYMASSSNGVAGPMPVSPLVITLKGIMIPAMGHVDVSLTTDEFGRAYAAANPEPSSLVLVLGCIGCAGGAAGLRRWKNRGRSAK